MLLATLLVLWLASPSHALAHANLLISNPEDGSLVRTAPASVRLLFTDSIVPIGTGMTIISPSGKLVSKGHVDHQGTVMSVRIDARERGTYLVIWRVISGDTHPSRGQFIFSVGARSAVPGSSGAPSSSLGLALQTLSRWLHFAGFALGFGPPAFALLVLRTGAVHRQVWRLVWTGSIALLMAEPLALLGQLASLQTTAIFDLTLATDVLASSFGRVLAQHVAAAILLWVLLGAVREAPRPIMAGMVGLGLAVALIDGEASHAVSSGPLALGVAANTIHVAAMGLWLGGLVTLLTLWRVPAIASRRVELLSRFGRIAAASLASLALSGAIMAAIHLGALANLFSTSYGQTLTAKTIVLVAAVTLAAISLRLLPHHRPRWWFLEVMILLVVVALAGLLVSLPPPA